MNPKSLILALLIAFVGASPSSAGPIIKAVVTAECKIQEDGSFANVRVDLNLVTHAFFGTSLSYTFTRVPNPSGIPPITLPSPASNSNPVWLSVPAGSYRLRISVGTSPWADYSVVVPAFQVATFGGHRRCLSVAVKPGPNAHLPPLGPHKPGDPK